MSVSLSTCLSLCLHVCLSVYMSVSPSTCLSLCLHVCLSVYMSVSLSTCLSVMCQGAGSVFTSANRRCPSENAFHINSGVQCFHIMTRHLRWQRRGGVVAHISPALCDETFRSDTLRHAVPCSRTHVLVTEDAVCRGKPQGLAAWDCSATGRNTNREGMSPGFIGLLALVLCKTRYIKEARCPLDVCSSLFHEDEAGS